MPTTAIVLGVTTAATQAYSAYEQSKSASNATKAETAAGQQALQIEQQQYQQGRTDLAPYRQAGSGALSKLGQIFGVPMDGGSASTPQNTTITPIPTSGVGMAPPGSALPTPGSSASGVNGVSSIGAGGLAGLMGGSSFPSALTPPGYAPAGATVPVQAPDGNIYRVPQAQLSAALQQGGKQVSQ